MEPISGKTIEASVNSSIRASAEVKATIRSYFSYSHYYNARHFAALCAARESSLLNAGKPFDPRHHAYAMAAVSSSISFIEAYINEIFQDAYHGHDSRLEAFTSSTRSLFASLWSVTEEKRRNLAVLDKYNLALELACHEPFNAGEDPYQSAKLTVAVRNFLAHYKPMDLGEESTHELETKLSGRFEPSPLMRGKGNAWFPAHAIGAGMASWAVRSTEGLVDSFIVRTGSKLDYKLYTYNDTPESLA
jgi:hypothetical protein